MAHEGHLVNAQGTWFKRSVVGFSKCAGLFSSGQHLISIGEVHKLWGFTECPQWSTEAVGFAVHLGVQIY